MTRMAKVICTIGPATSGRDSVRRLIEGGMDVARLNFSHGDHEFHKKMIRIIRKCALEENRPVAILQDLQGIKIRTGRMSGGGVELKRGREVMLLTGLGVGTEDRIFISYPHLVRDAHEGARVLLDDGLIELAVLGKARGRGLRARVVEGGFLKDRKGVNLPGMDIRARAFTKKDRADLALGLKLGVDFVAVSFVREPADIFKVRRAMRAAGRTVPLIAKIEKPEALAHIDAILSAADGIMVARGDLGVEVPPEEVPIIQKMLIEHANRLGKPVITATQMLESMTVHTTPTRAEVTDVANAVIDGTDALMLSAETSAGRFPHRALRMMARIIRQTESVMPARRAYQQGKSFSEAIAENAAEAARDIRAKYIVASTRSGYTARLLSAFRPSVPIIAYTPYEHVQRQLALIWGVIPLLMRPLKNTDDLFREVDRDLIARRLVKKGDPIVITASTPIGIEGKTNLLKLHRVLEYTFK